MQVISIDRSDQMFFCPATGQAIMDREGMYVTPAFLGYWMNEVPEEPTIHDPDLERHWHDYAAPVQEADDFLDVNEFLSAVEKPGWVAFEITMSGYACGPTSSTVWMVLDMNFENEAA